MVAIYDAVAAEWVEVSRPTASGISSVTADCTGTAFLAGSYDGRVYPSEIAARREPAVTALMSKAS